ncbi:ABC transporter permease [Flavobacterium haoranii]|uniref:Lipoprotein-releasing system permease protein n=1 Tax=Flavobacterium haoranii TaxID=683124 RepID=A0A1M6G383_9FLAO|nr:FtsX-like permease family protein [Flavobacterium haoranii]SHJ04389.1 lipoprotein-releasing system permease protein [Flavobacterium haoranii]
MNLEYFIAKRLTAAKSHKSSVSSPIIKIATVAIALGILMMIISVATGIGLQRKIREKVSAFNGHVIISNFDDNQSQVNTVPISTNQNFYPKFNLVDGIKHIQAVANKTGLIRTEETVEGIVLKGVGQDYDWNNIKEYLVQGKLPKISDQLTDEIIISEFLASRLKVKLNDVCRTYFLKEGGKGYNLRSFKVVGIFNSGFQEFDANYIIGDIKHVQKINKWQKDQVGQFEVFLNDFDKIEEKGNEIYKTIPPTYNSITIAEKYYSIFEWLKLFDFNIIVILIVMIVVATINMVVALLVLILERTQMIGILKALGATNWSVRKVFLYNAFHLIARGLLWGNVVAIFLLVIQKYFEVIKLNPQNYYVNVAPVYIDIPYIIVLNIGTILICIMVLIIPSYIITKISPVKVIRFD